MSRLNRCACWLGFLAISTLVHAGDDTGSRTPAEVFSGAILKVISIVEPGVEKTPQTFSTRLELTQAAGPLASVAGQTLDLAWQAPDRLRVEAKVDGRDYAAGRNQQELWIYAPSKHLGLVGRAGVPRFATAPERKDDTRLGRVKLPMPREQLMLLPLLMNSELLPEETVEGTLCHVLRVSAKPGTVQALKVPRGQFQFWLRQSDFLPVRLSYSEGEIPTVELRLQDVRLSDTWPAERWNISAGSGDRVETVALSHLTRFGRVVWAILNQKIPTLGPATGERRVLAREGQGRLELIDGTHLLILRGTPEEMGRQHGVLLRKQVRAVADRMLYGVGVASSFDKGRWFFAEIEQAQSRLARFMDERYLREMDALGAAAGLEREEIRLANYFPELFHCSGFALFGEATVGGRMYHGRILDYLRGVGLEQNAVVMVLQPDQGNAWVNISYAGFVGSVTAMNEKHVAIGEMGGRGEGNWDGKPMAQLVREVMEKANTLEEAVEIMRRGPRTCEYYYVISDAKSKRAVGIAATPGTFETVWPGTSHPRLPHAVKDAVLMSAGDRYEELARRVQAGHGKFDANSARDLMTRPVCMKSNIHSVLFEPETLDLWVANADAQNPASHTRYTQYNLAELLKEAPAGTQAAGVSP